MCVVCMRVLREPRLKRLPQEAIALPAQRIGAERDVDVPTTKRKLSFDDLLSHLKHYNANTRRGVWKTLYLALCHTLMVHLADAILGMRELCNAHPELVEPNLTALLNACVRLIGDEVRQGSTSCGRLLSTSPGCKCS
jgi:pre-rRNA-processing protein IPI1